MQNIQIIIVTASAALGFLTTMLTILAKFVKNAKAKIILENAIKISEEIRPFISQAEEFINYTGAEKKAYVLMQADQLAKEKHLSYDASAVSEQIDKLVELTKQVNKGTKNNKEEVL